MSTKTNGITTHTARQMPQVKYLFIFILSFSYIHTLLSFHLVEDEELTDDEKDDNGWIIKKRNFFY